MVYDLNARKQYVAGILLEKSGKLTDEEAEKIKEDAWGNALLKLGVLTFRAEEEESADGEEEEKKEFKAEKKRNGNGKRRR